MSRLIFAFLAFLLATPACAEIDFLVLPGGLHLAYYVCVPPGAGPSNILVGVQGYVRDANRTFDAAAAAAKADGHGTDTLIVAPIFQVPADDAAKCSFPGVPEAGPGDALWKCGNWSGGAKASNGEITSFQAMDSLLAILVQRYPSVHHITIAGFSAGGQYVQRYIGFARPPSGLQSLRYVVADPSAFLYFDTWRPEPGAESCPGYNKWKFGTEDLPVYLGRDAAAARQTYAHANIAYLEGALDQGTSPAAAYALLEKKCPAALQGPYRLQRGQAYAVYDQQFLAHGAHKLTIIPGCAHSVTCVFRAPAAAAALFGG
jgi:hypothetical protein